MKVIITGAGGYIGSVASQLFLKRNFEVVAIDNFTTGFRKPLQILQEEFGAGRIRFYEKDLNFDLDPIFDILVSILQIQPQRKISNIFC